jgi:hypothetical protein
MKKIIGIFFLYLFISGTSLFAQVTVEAIPANPQTGAHNYFGVKVTLPQVSAEDITVTGYIYDEGNGANTNHPFSLTVTAGNLTAETALNFYETEPTGSAVAELGTLVTMYAGVPITYEANGCILKFNSAADVNTVLSQLETDNDSYNDDYDSQYPNLTEEQLDDMDDQNGFDEFKTYKDFEGLFNGFCSKRGEIEVTETAWLANNFGGTDPDDIDLTFDDAENTIFNNNYSFKIGNDVYQLTSTGIYKNSVLQDEGGNAGILKKSNEFMNYNEFSNSWEKYSGPMTAINYVESPTNKFQNDNMFSLFMTDCKSNKKRKELYEYDNAKQRIKIKVSINSIVARNGVHGKVVHYKKKNSNWKRSRTEMAVLCGGTYYTNLCNDSHQFADRSPINGFKKRKQISVRRHSPGHIPEQGTVWKTYTDQIASSIDMPSIPSNIIGTLSLTF